MAGAMIYVHEVHEVVGGRMEEFGEAIRSEWRPLLEAEGDARLLWFWHLTHGTGASYQAVSITAVRDWATWGRLVERGHADPRFRDWQRRVWTLRREVTAKILRPVAWSPLADVDLAAAAPDRTVDGPAMYLHDTGWPFSGKLDEYVEALGSVFYPQTRRARMISVAACWTVAPGTGRHHEVVLLQRIEDWDQFSRLLTRGELGAQRGGWMEEGLRYRDRWESKLLRCAAWSPRQ
jgi:NIPSNAP protein